MKTITQTAPMTVMRPETIHVEKSIEIWPNTASQISHGMSMSTTSARPQAVYAIRSEAPSRRRIGTSEITTSEMPSMRAVAASAAAPLMAMNAPSARPSTARIQRLFFELGGSGRLRIAVEIVITLTRQAETATTMSVRSTPMAKATTRSCPRDCVLDLKAGVKSSAPKALAMTMTIP